MLTIKALRNIVSAKWQRRLPDSLVEFLEKTFRELHEAFEPEIDVDLFSLEMYGPIYILVAGLDGNKALKALGLQPEDSDLLHSCLEWVEKLELGQHKYWRIGVMPDNDYLFHVILPVNGFGPDFEQWLEEQYSGETSVD